MKGGKTINNKNLTTRTRHLKRHPGGHFRDNRNVFVTRVQGEYVRFRTKTVNMYNGPKVERKKKTNEESEKFRYVNTKLSIELNQCRVFWTEGIGFHRTGGLQNLHGILHKI